MRALLRENAIPFAEWHPGWLLNHGQYDAVIFTHPYDRERPRELWFNSLAASIPTTIYIPYGLSMGGGRKNLRLQFDQPTQSGASAVVARSEWEKKMYARHCSAGDAHVHVLGHPRFDYLFQEFGNPVPHEVSEFIDGRLAVLWNSHFSFSHSHSQSSNFSTFDLIGPELFQYAKANRDWLCLVWRPHPGLIPALVRDKVMSRDKIACLRSELAGIGVLLDDTSDHAVSFSASDALLTDVGSFLLEYMATGKPMLTLINPEGEPLNEEASVLVSNNSAATTAGEVFAFIETLRDRIDVQGEMISTDSDHLFGLDGKVGKRVALMIKAMVTGELDQIEEACRDCTPIIHARKHRHTPVSACVSKSPITTDIATPALDHLIRELQLLREQKANEAAWRKKLRRACNRIRTSLGEATKRSIILMSIIRTIRIVMRRSSRNSTR